MYDCKYYRLSVKGVETKVEGKKVTISIIPFVFYSGVSGSKEKATMIENSVNASLTLDFSNSFKSETHSSFDDLVKGLKEIEWFKSKNVMIEHAWDDEEGEESLSILSNSPDSIEMEDKLYFGFYRNQYGENICYCDVDEDYFKGTQDSLFIRDSLVSLNEKNSCKIINEQKSLTKKEDVVKSFPETFKKVFYSSKKDALEKILKEDRKIGESVWVKVSKSKPKEYVWVEGIEDKNLKLKG